MQKGSSEDYEEALKQWVKREWWAAALQGKEK